MKPLATTAFALALTLAVAPSGHTQTRTITNQLVVHLTFDDTMNDGSGRGNNATYTHTGTGSATPIYVAGRMAKAFQFTTTSSADVEYASLGYPDDLKFGTTTDFSVAFWVKHGAITGEDPAYIANRDWDTSNSRGWGIFAQGPPSGNDGVFRVHYTVTEPSIVKYAYRPAVVVNDNVWHQIAVTYQRGENVMTYFDGALKNSSPFNPAWAGTNTMDTYDLALPIVVNIGQDGSGDYSSAVVAAIDDVGIWRRVLTAAEVVNMYNFGQLGTNLFNVPDVTAPLLVSFTPANGAVGVVPNIAVTAIIQDQSTQVDTNSVQLFVDGVLAAHTLTKVGATNTITYTLPYLFAPSSMHTNKLVFADNTAIPTRTTNVHAYTISAWTNIYLGTPIVVEDFDELNAPTNQPAVYPTGWVAQNCTDPAGGAGSWNLFDPTSDAYLNWQIVPIEVVANNFGYDGRIYNVAAPVVADGVPWAVLGKKNIVFGASDQRSGSQVDYLFTCDYNLTGKTNVWLCFNSMYTQEKYQLGAIEYSIDQGTTWLPIVYMLDPATIVTNEAGIDAQATMSTYDDHIPYCQASGYGSMYGRFIGVAEAQWGNLGPYISARNQDDHFASHRVEQYRIAQADGQANVRFRFAMIGANYWDWGFDNFGLYTRTTAPDLQITSVNQSGPSLTINWNGSGANFSGLQKATSLNPASWSNIPGTIGQTTFTETIAGTTAFYRAVKF
jgi:hypothetical protein